ncbi:MAG: hypothetical protein JWM12_3454 [Ilumatobacteraceae bacterium]|nr:hypothetical protein [Ilumatobacteraceae bacterium]
MGADQPVRRIELIGVSDPDLFSAAPARPPSEPPPERSPRSGRLAVGLAVVALATVITVVAIGSGGAPPRTARVPTTTLATAPSTSITPPSPVDRLARLVGTWPPGFAPYVVDESAAQTVNAAPASSALWAEGNNASPGYRWMMATATLVPVATTLAGSVRIAVPLGLATATFAKGGSLIVGPIPGGQAAIRFGGLSLDEASAVLANLTIVSGRVHVADDLLPGSMRLVGQIDLSVSAVWSPLTETRALQVATSDPASVAGDLSVQAGPPMSTVQQAVERFFLVATHHVQVGGRDGMLGTNTLTGLRTVTFDRDDLHVVVASSVLDDDALVAYGASLRPASDDAWAQLERNASSAPAGASQPSAGQRHLAGGPLPDGGSWSVRCGAVGHDGRIGVQFAEDGPNGRGIGSASTLAGSTPGIVASALTSLTVVVARLPAATAGAVLRIRTSAATIDAPLHTVDGIDGVAAVGSFTELGAYTARIVGADGTVLATYDPLQPATS